MPVQLHGAMSRHRYANPNCISERQEGGKEKVSVLGSSAMDVAWAIIKCSNRYMSIKSSRWLELSHLLKGV